MSSYKWIDRSGLILLEVASNDWFATFSLNGAHLLSYHGSKEESEMFWLSEKAPEQTGLPFNGGVPIVFPWFGASEKGEPYPNHGFARNLPWKFIGVEDLEDSCDVIFELSDSPLTKITWPYSFRIRLTTKLRPHSVESVFAITNTGDRPFECEALLHPYFRLKDINKAEVKGLDGVPFWDKNTDSTSIQDGNIILGKPVDFVNEHGDHEYEIIEDGKPSFLISKKNSTQTVVWNPGAGSKLGAKAPDFVCVEPGCVKKGKLIIAPDHTHILVGKYKKV